MVVNAFNTNTWEADEFETSLVYTLWVPEQPKLQVKTCLKHKQSSPNTDKKHMVSKGFIWSCSQELQPAEKRWPWEVDCRMCMAWKATEQ